MSDKPHTLINSIEPVFVPDELAPNPDPVGTVKWNEQPTHDPDWAETWNKKRVGFLGYDYAEADDEMANLVLKSELDAALARIKDLERQLENAMRDIAYLNRKLDEMRDLFQRANKAKRDAIAELLMRQGG